MNTKMVLIGPFCWPGEYAKNDFLLSGLLPGYVAQNTYSSLNPLTAIKI